MKIHITFEAEQNSLPQSGAVHQILEVINAAGGFLLEYRTGEREPKTAGAIRLPAWNEGGKADGNRD